MWRDDLQEARAFMCIFLVIIRSGITPLRQSRVAPLKNIPDSRAGESWKRWDELTVYGFVMRDQQQLWTEWKTERNYQTNGVSMSCQSCLLCAENQGQHYASTSGGTAYKATPSITLWIPFNKYRCTVTLPEAGVRVKNGTKTRRIYR